MNNIVKNFCDLFCVTVSISSYIFCWYVFSAHSHRFHKDIFTQVCNVPEKYLPLSLPYPLSLSLFISVVSLILLCHRYVICV